MNVVLVHGIFDTGRKFRWLEADLTKKGYHCLAPTLTPNDARNGIADLAKKLEAKVNEKFGPDKPIVIVGFSMGCLVSRYYIAHLGGAHRTRAFFAISGPNHGTLTAYLYPDQGARDMRFDSPLLRDLNSSNASNQRENFPIYTYWTPFDLIIIPQNSSRLPHASNTIIWAPLHPLMVYSKRVRNDILAKIERLD